MEEQFSQSRDHLLHSQCAGVCRSWYPLHCTEVLGDATAKAFSQSISHLYVYNTGMCNENNIPYSG